MMPGWLLRLLPWAGALIALVATLAWIDHRGYRRAMADRDARDAVLRRQILAEMHRSEHRLARRLDALGADYARRSAAIAAARTVIQPTITREIMHETRLADPSAGLTPGLLAAVNRARATGACAPGPAGSPVCALPAAASGR